MLTGSLVGYVAPLTRSKPADGISRISSVESGAPLERWPKFLLGESSIRTSSREEGYGAPEALLEPMGSTLMLR
jgi:hypothetical protein